MNFEVQELVAPKVKQATKEKPTNKLIVYNDDVNTFDWVIQSLVEVCNHTSTQAEQCSLIIHFNGKCDVRSGEMHVLRPMKEGLTDRGIQATIE